MIKIDLLLIFLIFKLNNNLLCNFFNNFRKTKILDINLLKKYI